MLCSLSPALCLLTLALARPAATQDLASTALEVLGVDAPTLEWPGEEIEFPMPFRNGRSLVEVYVGDEGPLNFLIDTGSSLTVLDTRTVQALELPAVGEMEVGAPGGGTVPAEIVEAPPLRIGGLAVSGAHPIVLAISEMTGGVIEGVLGMDLFGEVLLTLDPANEQATVSRQRLRAGDPGVVVLDTGQGRWNFEIDVAGHKVPAHVDTGSPGGFTLPVELLDVLPLQPGAGHEGSVGLVGGQRKMSYRSLDGAVRFAGLSYQDPQVGFMDPSPGAANIGSAIMATLVQTIDQKNGLMAFAESDSSSGRPRQAADGPRRLGVGFRGVPGAAFSSVSSVAPGSLGAQAGFQVGDRLVKLNGRPMSDYDTAALRELIGGSSELTWELERDGERLVIEMP